MLECISNSVILGSHTGPRPQGGSPGAQSPGYPGSLLVISSADSGLCPRGLWNPSKAKNHAILSLRSHHFQGASAPTPLLIPPTHPEVKGSLSLVSSFSLTSPFRTTSSMHLTLLKTENQKGKCLAGNFCLLSPVRRNQNLALYLSEGR